MIVSLQEQIHLVFFEQGDPILAQLFRIVRASIGWKKRVMEDDDTPMRPRCFQLVFQPTGLLFECIVGVEHNKARALIVDAVAGFMQLMRRRCSTGRLN